MRERGIERARVACAEQPARAVLGEQGAYAFLRRRGPNAGVREEDALARDFGAEGAAQVVALVRDGAGDDDHPYFAASIAVLNFSKLE